MRKPSRPTMSDVALQAGVGVATVDRVLNRRAPVAAGTARRVLDAAQAIGFHATSLLKQRIDDAGEECTLGFLLQKGSQSFYQALSRELTLATRAAATIRGRPLVEFIEDLTPAHVAARLEDLGSRTHALAVVAADHPKVSAAVERVTAKGVPVFALLSDLSTPARVGYIGIDHRKAGRSAAWTISKLAPKAGTIGIFVGSHRYLGQDLNEISFRSYIREHAPQFRLLEPLASFEDAQFAQETARDLLRRNPDLVGIYVAGGGIEGVIEALREIVGERHIVLVCYELVAETRSALIDGVADVVIATPIEDLAERTVAEMIRALKGQSSEGAIFLPFRLYISENL